MYCQLDQPSSDFVSSDVELAQRCWRGLGSDNATDNTCIGVGFLFTLHKKHHPCGLPSKYFYIGISLPKE